MTHAALSPLIGPEFDQFLGASIGEDRNGTRLSVLSALARLDVDPWKEATSLARMPREAAAVRLTELIEALPFAPTSAIHQTVSQTGNLLRGNLDGASSTRATLIAAQIVFH